MEKYDPGLTVIADAQKARDAGQKQDAYAKYLQGIEKLFQSVNDEENEETAKMVRKHIARFMDEAEAVKTDLSKPDPKSVPFQQAQAAERKAKESEKAYKFALALHQYKQAAEHYMTYQKEVDGNDVLVKWARERVLATITKAEAFQKLTKKPEPQNLDALLFDLPSVPTDPKPGQGPASTGSCGDSETKIGVLESAEAGKLANSLANAFVRGKPKCSAEEQKVLVRGSKINGKTFEFMYLGDTEEKHFLGENWTDHEGFPKLSEAQKEHGAVLGRPAQFMSSPEVVKAFSFHSICQPPEAESCLAASLAACAAWERRTGKALISRTIHPQRNGVPVTSPNGRYVVKLLLNGAIRKAVLDDLLPVTRAAPQRLLCASSSVSGELWVPLLDKAFAKLHNSYGRTGSDSASDVHALCGWIPETMRLLPGTDDDDKDVMEGGEVWSRVVQGHNKGTAIFTLTTRAMTEEEAAEHGLGSQCAHAVVEAREVLGQRVVRLKSPKSHLRWKRGIASDGDSWTPELKRSLSIDEDEEQDEADGLSWMSWEGVCRFFACVHASWSPARFSVRTKAHFHWTKTQENHRHYDDNPQFVLRVTAKQRTVIWLLLSRHYSGADEDPPSTALHVGRGNRRIYHNTNAAFVLRGAYSSKRHNLVRLPCDKGNQSFVVCVDIKAPTGTLPFTLTSYSTEPAALYHAVDCPRLEAGEATCVAKTFKYRWDDKSAGGPASAVGFERNPMFRLEVRDSQRVFVKLVLAAPPEQASAGGEGVEATPVAVIVEEGKKADGAETKDDKGKEGEQAQEVSKDEKKGEEKKEVTTAGHVFKKGDKAMYLDRWGGGRKEVEIVSVDHALQPPSYLIRVDGHERETEAERLTPMTDGEKGDADKKSAGADKAESKDDEKEGGKKKDGETEGDSAEKGEAAKKDGGDSANKEEKTEKKEEKREDKKLDGDTSDGVVVAKKAETVVKGVAKYPSAVGIHLYVNGERVRHSDVAVQPAGGQEAYTPHVAWREYQLAPGYFTLACASGEEGAVADFAVTLKSEKPIALSSLPYKPLPPQPAPPPPGGRGVGFPPGGFMVPPGYAPGMPIPALPPGAVPAGRGYPPGTVMMPHGYPPHMVHPGQYPPGAFPPGMVPIHPGFPYPPGVAPPGVDPAAAGKREDKTDDKTDNKTDDKEKPPPSTADAASTPDKPEEAPGAETPADDTPSGPPDSAPADAVAPKPADPSPEKPRDTSAPKLAPMTAAKPAAPQPGPVKPAPPKPSPPADSPAKDEPSPPAPKPAEKGPTPAKPDPPPAQPKPPALKAEPAQPVVAEPAASVVVEPSSDTDDEDLPVALPVEMDVEEESAPVPVPKPTKPMGEKPADAGKEEPPAELKEPKQHAPESADEEDEGQPRGGEKKSGD